MADTPRTLAALQTLLANNTAAGISPQDIRDFLVSVLGGYGGITALGASTAQASISGTPAKLTGFAANAPASDTTPDHTDDSVTGGEAGKYMVDFQCSFSGTASKTFLFRVYSQGIVTTLGCQRKLGTGGDVGSCSCIGILALDSADVITTYVSSSDGGVSVTVVDAQLTLTRLD